MSISVVSPVTSYLSAIKDEPTAAATYAKTDSVTRQQVATFEKDATSITSVDGLLKNYSVLQVVLGAYGLSSIANETALIKDLLTQDPTSSKSLARSSGNAAWLAFADAFKIWGQNKGSTSVSPFLADGVSDVLAQTFTATTSISASITLPSAAKTGQSYTTAPVTAYDSSSTAHQVALKWAQSTTNPLAWTVSAYDADGNAAVQANAYQVTFNPDGTMASVTDASTGDAVPPATDGTISLPLTLNIAQPDGTYASQALGLDLGTPGGTGGVTMATGNTPSTSINASQVASLTSSSGSSTTLTLPSITLGSLSGTGQTYVTAPFDPNQASDTANGVSPDNQTTLSVKWVQSTTAPSTWQAYIIDPYGSTVTSTALTTSFDSTGNLLQVNGQYTHTIPPLQAQVNGVAYTVNIQPPNVSTSALTPDTTLTNNSTVVDTASGVNIGTVVSQFEQEQYENSPDMQDDGVGNALYFTRKMSGITSLSQLMSDTTLLTVAETVSGYDPSTFGTLDYDEQVRLLKNKVDLTKLSTPKEIQQYAEQYLALLQITPQKPDKPASLMDLYGGDTSDEGIAALFGASDSSSSSSSGLYSSMF
ncbi:DUF1217 domain-containing protein [Gluconacetobacter sacchari]|uniref:DUF1217 domain-containing protein n=2 Tax=Gluconacetobacter sacchari TaxID=92759 RepID=A0A7W4I9A8_9PROT|nr:DUF1217 domain-containing protein [Gluconacetobacter sacchari]MBB2158646.1 DUF1217 domain-containing protein [Gluconacetobacter sacchari]GBQ18885.1 hypothetical protein AA12717_0066 [Gluconacetobacter sacchari DSM 12717]